MPSPSRTRLVALLVAALGLPALVPSTPLGGLTATTDAVHAHADGVLHDHGLATGIDSLATGVDDVVRGVVWDGLVRDAAACGRLLRLVDVGGDAPVCSHGPDPAPVGTDVRSDETPPVPPSSAAGRDLLCDGDGRSGSRVQVLYARIAGERSRLARYRDSFGAWMAQAQEQVEASTRRLDRDAAPLHPRVVHDRGLLGGCTLDVVGVTLSRRAERRFDHTVAELRDMGFDRPDRKYLVFMDASRYCGVATQWDDTRPDPEVNRNERRPSWARVDVPCWEWAALHELFHNLGAVAGDAPNGSGNGHCNDDRDVMCYADGGRGSRLYVDPRCADRRAERLLDCNGDDYFNPSPPGRSWLARHWNTADSAYLAPRSSLLGGFLPGS